MSRVLKPEKESSTNITFRRLEYEYFFFVTNTTLLSEKVVISHEKRGNAENYIKEAKYDMAVVIFYLNHFGQMKRCFK